MQAVGTDLVVVCSNIQPAAIDDQAARILPIPASYYDELAARLGAGRRGVGATARAEPVCYRDDSGTFRHASADDFHDRFFFEIVERRGYRGFGAANAGVRMAAQTQRRPAGDLAARMALLQSCWDKRVIPKAGGWCR